MRNYKAKYLALGSVNIHYGLKHLRSSLPLWSGLVIILFIISISLFLPCPTASQYRLFRVCASIGLASFGSAIPGAFKLNASGIVKIVTGLAVFLVAYFSNPNTIIIRDNCDSTSTLRGLVMYNERPLPDVKISSALLNQSDLTNNSGEFDIQYDTHQALPLKLRFEFENIDTTITFDSFPTNQPLVIQLRDTLPVLDSKTINEQIRAYLDQFEQKITADHLQEFHEKNGTPSNLTEISNRYKAFDRISSRYRNRMVFTNGFNTLSTQRSIRAAGIQMDPMNPYHAYWLSNSAAFIYKDVRITKEIPLQIDFSFAFINTNEVDFSISRIEERTATECVVTTLFEENIRLVKTSVHFDEYGERLKLQETEFKGMRPVEEFVFRYERGRWKLKYTINTYN
ncbi:hypothetical protein [Phaeocystidibacter marisrubri]|uniref:Uncharacterized protein n=1 Tax=Phaeocystidibacter marisrubri TaxID=1577780 RepID=A0A6L3ZHW6_9FLAO|nr:hypothetical protein [Phaeocystidibacter marisrubri]KAB2817075.1 hypothetical protein F8C82_01375 [Phaeocystidibacter marisrubri]GGH76963.1 hypothetical protein GCM10011318_26020 [Phaeocystidibacter marisrubri]